MKWTTSGTYSSLTNLAQGARALGANLPNTASCQELFNAAVAAGGKVWDYSDIVRVLEGLACHEMGQETSDEMLEGEAHTRPRAWKKNDRIKRERNI